jgi:cation diffusion facilitator family transporter
MASLVVLAGLLISRRDSRSFPYGLYKVENLASVLVALLILLAGYEIARETLFAPPRDLANAPLALAGVAISLLTVCVFSRYERRLGKEASSPSLIADSERFRVDMLASAVVFASILGRLLGVRLDRFGSAVVELFVLRAGWSIFVGCTRVLLDASLNQETPTRVRDQIAGEPGVAEVRSLVGRNSGRYKFLDLATAVRTPNLAEAHRPSERLDESIKANVANVDRVVIHCEPRRNETSRWAVPLESPEGAVSPHLGKAPYVAIVEVHPSSGEVIGYEVIGNPYLGEDRQKGIKLASSLPGAGWTGWLCARASTGGARPTCFRPPESR